MANLHTKAPIYVGILVFGIGLNLLLLLLGALGLNLMEALLMVGGVFLSTAYFIFQLSLRKT